MKRERKAGTEKHNRKKIGGEQRESRKRSLRTNRKGIQSREK